MVKAAQETDGENETLKRAVVDLSMVHQKTLVDFVTKAS